MPRNYVVFREQTAYLVNGPFGVVNVPRQLYIFVAMKRPKKGEYAPFHETYLSKVPSRGTALSLLKKTFKDGHKLLSSLPEERGDYRYEPGKWSIKELLMHIIDTERVFAYRTLSFMRADRIGLPGFNQDFWMEQVDVSNRSIKDLLKEWKAVRDNTIFLCQQCSEEQSRFIGSASNWKASVRAYFFIIIGHYLHHEQILKERYLSFHTDENSVTE